MLCESSVTVELAIYHGQCPCLSHTAVMKCGDRAITGAYSLLLKPAFNLIQMTKLYICLFIVLHVGHLMLLSKVRPDSVHFSEA